jgi:protein-arginine kinase activator protein McsA
MDDYGNISKAFRLVSACSCSSNGVIEPQCPGCGLILQDLIVNMRVKCRQCYATFEGVVDVVSPADDNLKNDILSQQLADAIREERYEDAADIRDLMEVDGE